jgi:hypothetical protein
VVRCGVDAEGKEKKRGSKGKEKKKGEKKKKKEN